ncbi:ATP-binding protein [Enhygromyxa salina]|nr:protein kinase [Enhygromyxa salina]
MFAVSLEWIANRFRVLEELGHGGMGTVYRVQDTLGDERHLALKTFRSDVPITPERRLRFREEFRAMARLRHPNTVEVYDCGFLDGQTEYLTMELVPGRELSQMLVSGGLEFQTIYALTLQLLLALEFIHSRLYVHRDIKPSNLRVRDDGTLKVMDFGLMEWLGSRSTLSAIGTAAYMAPEAVVGGALDTSADLYSVGCVLFEMTTGRPPFLGTTSETLRAHINETPASLRQYRSDAPPELEAIVRRLLAKDVHERYASAAEVADDVARLAGAHHIRENLARNTSYLISDLMVGREREFAHLEQLAADAARGQARSLFIGGPAGVGKSRLMQETLIQAKLRGAQVVHVQCKPSTGPYESFATALRPLLSLSAPDQFSRHLSVSNRLDGAASHGSEPGHGPDDSSPSFDKHELAADVTSWLLAVAAKTPMVLAIEDLQWCDLPSLDLLNHCLRHMRSSRVLCVATLRSDEASLDSPLWFTVQDGQTEHLELEAFDKGQVRRLVESMLHELRVTDAFIEALFHATAGNAFFVTEVMRDLMEQGVLVATEAGWSLPTNWEPRSLPNSIDVVVLERLGRLSQSALELARVAAVLGSSLDRESLLALSGVDEDRLFGDVEALTERWFLTREDRRYVFPHERVREVLYDDIPAAARQDLHRRCGEYLERRHADQLDAQLAALAYHFTRGGAPGKALEYTLRAGDAAKRSGAESLAIEYWSRALELLETDSPDGPNRADADALAFDLSARIAENALVLWPSMAFAAAARCREALESRGNIDKVCALLKKVVAGFGRLPASARDRAIANMTKPQPYRHQRAPSRRRLRLPPPISSWAPKVLESYVLGCVAAGMAGEPARGLPLGERALGLLPFKRTPLEGAMATALAGCLQAAGHLDAMGDVLVRARKFLFNTDLSGNSVAMSARVGAAVFSNCMVFQGRRFDPQMVEYGLWAVDAIQKPDFYNQVWASPCLWYAWTGRQEQAEELLARIAGNCRKIGSPPYPWALYLRPYLAWQQGAFDEAQALVGSALRYPQIDRMMLAREYACVLEGHIHLAMDEFDQAHASFAAVEHRARKVGMDLVVLLALNGRAELLTRLGEFELARAALDQVLAGTASGPTRNPLQHAIATRLSADLLIRTGEFTAAEAALRRATSILSTPEQDNRIEQGRLLRGAAELALARGDAPEALAALVRAEACFGALGNKYMVRVTHARRISAGLASERDPATQTPMPDQHQSTPDADTADIKNETLVDERTTSPQVLLSASEVG